MNTEHERANDIWSARPPQLDRFRSFSVLRARVSHRKYCALISTPSNNDETQWHPGNTRYFQNRISIIDNLSISGLAIAAVLAFHLDEATFPSGYIGVDMWSFRNSHPLGIENNEKFRFFVLSGYLMAVILSKESYLNLKSELAIAFVRKIALSSVWRLLHSSLQADSSTLRHTTSSSHYCSAMFSFAKRSRKVCSPLLIFFTLDSIRFCDNVVWAAAFATNVHTVSEEEDYFAQVFRRCVNFTSIIISVVKSECPYPYVVTWCRNSILSHRTIYYFNAAKIVAKIPQISINSDFTERCVCSSILMQHFRAQLH